MKKAKWFLIGLFLLVMPITSFAANIKPQEMILDFEGQTNHVNTVIYRGVSLMEVKSFSDALGFRVAFTKDKGTKIVGIMDPQRQRVLVLYVNKTQALITENGKSTQLTASFKPVLIQGRTYVPARFLVENMGLTIRLEGDRYVIGHSTEIVAEPTPLSPEPMPSIPPVVPSQPIVQIPQGQEQKTPFYKSDKKIVELDTIVVGNVFMIDAIAFAKEYGIYSSVETGADNRTYLSFSKVSKANLQAGVVIFTLNDPLYAVVDGAGNQSFFSATVPAFAKGDKYFVGLDNLTLGLGIQYKNDNKAVEVVLP